MSPATVRALAPPLPLDPGFLDFLRLLVLRRRWFLMSALVAAAAVLIAWAGFRPQPYDAQGVIYVAETYRGRALARLNSATLGEKSGASLRAVKAKDGEAIIVVGRSYDAARAVAATNHALEFTRADVQRAADQAVAGSAALLGQPSAPWSVAEIIDHAKDVTQPPAMTWTWALWTVVIAEALTVMAVFGKAAHDAQRQMEAAR